MRTLSLTVLKQDMNHHSVKDFYRRSPQTNAEMNRQLKEMLEADIIEESDSMWQSPVVILKKKNMSEGKFDLMICLQMKINLIK